MGDLEVRIRHGGGGPDMGTILTAAGIVAGAAAVAGAGAAVAAIPVWVMVAVPVTLAAAIVAGLRALVRHNHRQAAAFTARCAEYRAVEAAAKAERKRHRLELAAASAPHVNVDLGALADLLRDRGQQPVITLPPEAIKEMPR